MIDLAGTSVASGVLRVALGIILAFLGLALVSGALAVLMWVIDRLDRGKRICISKETRLPLFKYGLSKLKKSDVEKN